MYQNWFENKKVLVTGNTGFKGTWLTLWLLKMQAIVIGISKDIPTNPSMFEDIGLIKKINHYFEDIANEDAVKKIIHKEKPDYVFHLATQAIVSESYKNPLDTIKTNVLGTAVLLDSLRLLDSPCTAVIITSDKCYDNVEWCWGYRENDRLGGKDIYSASKAAAENIFKAYYNSFLAKKSENIRIATARAGNVIGGGDWANDRLIPDCIRAWSAGEKVTIRSPESTRPWQHVLEPLSGYLKLAMMLNIRPVLSGGEVKLRQSNV